MSIDPAVLEAQRSVVAVLHIGGRPLVCACGACERCKNRERMRRSYVPVPRRPMRRCSFPKCLREHHAHGYCDAHDKQRTRGVTLHPVGERVKARKATVEKARAALAAHGIVVEAA